MTKGAPALPARRRGGGGGGEKIMEQKCLGNKPAGDQNRNAKRRKLSNAENAATTGVVTNHGTSSSSNIKMTPNAVRKMLLAEPYEGPLLVGLYCPNNSDNVNGSNSATTTDPSSCHKIQEFQMCQICDNSFLTTVLVRNDQLVEYHRQYQQQQQDSNANIAQKENKRTASTCATESNDTTTTTDWLMVKICGYITSVVNATGTFDAAFEPLLCITHMTVLPVTCKPASTRHKMWKQLVKGKRKTLLSNAVPNSSIGVVGNNNNNNNNKSDTTNNNNNNNNNAQGKLKLPGGFSAPFLARYAQQIPPEDWMGQGRQATITCTATTGGGGNDNFKLPAHEAEFEQNCTVVQDFLTHHKAMKTLQDSNWKQLQEQPKEPLQEQSQPQPQQPQQQPQQHHHKQQHELYFSALREFASSQQDRQKASLASNSGKATAENAAKVVEQHNKTFEVVMKVVCQRYCEQQQHRPQQHPQQQAKPWITVELLKEWHAILCGNGLHATAGQFRTNTVKAGRTVFCKADKVTHLLKDELLQALQILELRLGQVGAPLQALACLTYASAVFFGVVDIHPFSDGNGRMARLLGSAAMQVLGFPFCINWFATPAQRRDYVLATLMTRRNLSLVYRGDTISETSKAALMRSAIRAAGLFFPLVSLLMDRVRKAIPEVKQLHHDKQLSAIEHAEAVAARRVRERAAAGSCLICFDDNPNIATLCCGKAVHLNCIAEWLSSNSSCPNCRGTLPALPRRPARRGTFNNNGDQEETTTTITADENNGDDTTGENDTTSDTTDDDDDDDGTASEGFVDFLVETMRIQALARMRHQASARSANNSDAGTDDTTTEEDDEDENTTDVADDQNQNQVNNNNRSHNHSNNNNNNNEDEDEDDTVTYVVAHNTESGGRGREAEEDSTSTTDDTTAAVDPENDDTTSSYHENEDTRSANTGTVDDNESSSSARDDGVQGSRHQRGSIIGCMHCNNHAAQECCNFCCGRCCLIHGFWACPRHSY